MHAEDQSALTLFQRACSTAALVYAISRFREQRILSFLGQALRRDSRRPTAAYSLAYPWSRSRRQPPRRRRYPGRQCPLGFS